MEDTMRFSNLPRGQKYFRVTYGLPLPSEPGADLLFRRYGPDRTGTGPDQTGLDRTGPDWTGTGPDRTGTGPDRTGTAEMFRALGME